MKTKAEISFYHLTTTPLEKALPKILDKIVASNKRAIIFFSSDDKMEEMNRYLWSFSTKTVIPHGSSKDEYPEEQPIYLTCSNDNPNGASILVLPSTLEYENIDPFEKCLYIFDGNLEQELGFARAKWMAYKDQGYNLIYWKQKLDGGWEKS